MRLEGKVAVVTGASQGIGEATAKKMAKEGALVVCCARSIDKLEKLVEDIKNEGGEAIAVKGDVSKREDVENVVNTTMEKYKKIDTFIINAGVTADGKFVKMSDEKFDKVIDINLKGAFYCGQEAAKVMVEQGYGSILITSSVVGTYGNFGQSNYAASKFGVNGMMKTWAKELSPKGVRVNCISPGFIATEMVKAMPEKIIDMMTGKTPIGRLGTPEDIANAFVFLASDEASFITGENLAVDGGVVL